MTNFGLRNQQFLARYWRKHPLLIRGFLTATELGSYSRQRFDAWCQVDTTARVYLRIEKRAPGAATARRMAHPSDGLALYNHYAHSGEEITLLLNGVERVDTSVLALQDRFHIPYTWRLGDTVATLSAVHAGIGYHGGSEDGFIVQLRGQREWTIWPCGVLSAEYQRSLCGHPIQPEPDVRSTMEPLLRVSLKPGDALYIPALYPHEGITLIESISLAVSWRGLSAYQAFVEIYEARTALGAPTMNDEVVDALCVLVQDPPEAADPLVFLTDQLSARFKVVPPVLRPELAEIQAYLNILFERPPTGSSRRLARKEPVA